MCRFPERAFQIDESPAGVYNKENAAAAGRRKIPPAEDPSGTGVCV